MLNFIAFWLKTILSVCGIALVIYYIPYLIKRGWDSGKYSAQRKN